MQLEQEGKGSENDRNSAKIDEPRSSKSKKKRDLNLQEKGNESSEEARGRTLAKQPRTVWKKASLNHEITHVKLKNTSLHPKVSDGRRSRFPQHRCNPTEGKKGYWFTCRMFEPESGAPWDEGKHGKKSALLHRGKRGHMDG